MASGAPSAAPVAGGDCGAKCLSIEKCEAGACAPARPPNEVYVPKTPPEGFTMGRGKVPYGFGKLKNGTPADGFGDAPHNVVLTKPFCMDATEVIVKEMVRCVKSRPSTARYHLLLVDLPEKVDYPVHMIDWHVALESTARCTARGSRRRRSGSGRPTGGDGREWPWGNEPPTCELADYTRGISPAPAATPAATAAARRRWRRTRRETGSGRRASSTIGRQRLGVGARQLPRIRRKDEVDPRDGIGERPAHVVRGGGWNRSADGIRASFRGGAMVRRTRCRGWASAACETRVEPVFNREGSGLTAGNRARRPCSCCCAQSALEEQ